MLKLEIIKGNVKYDVTNMFEKITWSGRKGAAPRCLKITLLDDDGHNHERMGIDCAEGEKCVFYEDDKELFRGIVVSHQQNQTKKMTITAYDNLYYVANSKDSFNYSNVTATDIFKDCMTRMKMEYGTAAKTSYVIPSLPKAKTTYWDVLLDALSVTYTATGRRYYINSAEGKINLLLRTEYAMKWVLEAGSDISNITGYSYSKSIENLRTSVRVLSKRGSVVCEKSNNSLESKIGKFTEIKSLNDTFNRAQIQELVDEMLKEKGSPTQNLSVSSIGISDAVSGRAVYVIIPHLKMNRVFYIDEDTHTYTQESHTMQLKLSFAKDISSAG